MAFLANLTLTLVGADDEPIIFDPVVQRDFSMVQADLQEIDLELEVGLRVHSSAGGTGRVWQTGDYVMHAFHHGMAVEIAEALRRYLEAKTGRLVRLYLGTGGKGVEAARAEDVRQILSSPLLAGSDEW